METSPLVLFDGVCNFCNGSINFIIKHDQKGIFQFAPLQSEAGERTLKSFSIPDHYLDSLVYIENNRCYVKSTAALKIARRLDGGWKLFYAAIIVPRPIRDYIYSIIAKNRYKWFGKRDACMIPTPDVRKRFLN
ncbi:thiol-disulfide oxidoreductase DCC family protein [Priestia koreensis]|uniref:thiol-disulfide oxidoreductase DCC family protein n=1 Tax=Priestia koreensis TaxID=284581 RepID=UPI00203F2EF5|nr:thiol-disulfide oxidoreductase DCC family protein [Priestia koreensis]MCM3006458.1 thiol-disulfide oxidoreductase DCC family protein [Priestia koreensis]